MSECEGTVGEITDALKTVMGICRLYSVHFFIPMDEGIAVYNASNDDFHFFQWASEIGHYIFCGSKEQIPDWLERRIGI